MIVRLVVEHGRRRRVLTIQPPGGLLGRGKGNAVRIPSAEVSRKHCRLRIEENQVFVEDLDSVNGTILNGKAVYDRTPVRSGDILQVGPVRFVVEYEAAGRANEKVPVLEEAEDLDLVDPVENDPLVSAASNDPVDLELDFIDQPWNIPEGEDLRDILSQMEDTSFRDDERKKRRR